MLKLIGGREEGGREGGGRERGGEGGGRREGGGREEREGGREEGGGLGRKGREGGWDVLYPLYGRRSEQVCQTGIFHGYQMNRASAFVGYCSI